MFGRFWKGFEKVKKKVLRKVCTKMVLRWTARYLGGAYGINRLVYLTLRHGTGPLRLIAGSLIFSQSGALT